MGLQIQYINLFVECKLKICLLKVLLPQVEQFGIRWTNYIACSAPHSRASHSSWQRRPHNNLSADIHHLHSSVLSRLLSERELMAAYGQTDMAMASLF